MSREESAVSQSPAANSSVAPHSPITAGRPFGLWSACAVLTMFTLAGFGAVTIALPQLGGRATWQATAVAAGVCWFAALLSLIVSHRIRLKGAAVTALLAGMLLRMAIPLGLAIAMVNQAATIVDSGLLGQIAIFYVLTLAIETWLSLVLIKTATKSVAPRATANPASAQAEGSGSHG